MSKATPGPWAIVARDAPRCTLMIESRHGLIAVMESSKTRPVTYEKAESNALLIAAAPDLLHALEMVRDADNDCVRDGLQTIPPIARKTIDDAIAKATGESQ